MLLHDDVVTDREPKPGSFSGRLRCQERIEHFFFYFKWNTRAVIPNADFHAIAKAGEPGLVHDFGQPLNIEEIAVPTPGPAARDLTRTDSSYCGCFRQLSGLFCNLATSQQFNVARRAIDPDENRALAPLRLLVLSPHLFNLNAGIVFVTLTRRRVTPWRPTAAAGRQVRSKSNFGT